MKKNLLKLMMLVCSLPFAGNAFAQCSGGSPGGSITPTSSNQTITVPDAGYYYTFYAVANYTYQFSFCSGDGGYTPYDSQITILDNSGNYANGYNDDYCSFSSFLQWTCTASGTYRVLISEYYCLSGGGQGSSTLAYHYIAPSGAPANDICSGALAIPVPGSVAGSTTSATADVAPSCSVVDNTSGGVWYTVTGTGQAITASLCTGTNYDCMIRVFSGSCGNLSCVAGNDDYCGLLSQVTWCSTSGTTYYILVYGFSTNTGNYMLTMSETAIPTPSVTPSSPAICSGNSTALTASNCVYYTWSPSTGLNTATGANVTANPTATTTYTVTGIDGNSCAQTTSVTVTVNSLPAVTLGSFTPVCADAPSFMLTGESPAGGTYSGTGVTAGSFDAAAAGAGTHTITYNYIDGNGCSSSAASSITVNALPSVTATSATICAGSTTPLTASGASAYTWSPAAGLDATTGTSVNASPSASSTYTVTGIDVNACSDTAIVTVNVNPLPVITLSPFATVCVDAAAFTLTGGSPAGGIYSGTGVSSGIFDPAAAGAGTFTITYDYMDVNGCTASASQNIIVDQCTGIGENANENITLYPNPTTGVITIIVPASSSDAAIEVTDVSGRLLYHEAGVAASNGSRIDLSRLANGIYYLSLRASYGTSVQKIVIQH